MVKNRSRNLKTRCEVNENTKNIDMKYDESISPIKRLFGFELRDVSSWTGLVTILCRPCHPSSLAIMRILFGMLMLLDLHQERGLSNLDEKWSSSRCHFPFFDFLQPLPLPWMYCLYFLMAFGIAGIILGLFYHQSCLLFLIPYWYMFFLDTTAWNNHSYLFGILGYLLFLSNANRYWALDVIRNPKLKNTRIPLWNYAIFRAQIFLVYFLAGLKKMNADWIGGYSMRYLSSHWVFLPFRLFLNEEQVDHYIIHLFGFAFDLTIGFFMYFDHTQNIAFVFCASFNLMNSQLFNIGMFPFVMIASMPIFCSMDWPANILSKISCYWKIKMAHHHHLQIAKVDFVVDEQINENCIYSEPQKECAISVKQKKRLSFSNKPKLQKRHHIAVILILIHISIQGFLPFSHFITQGYNHWTEGLYGYSWDMMVHSWHHLHSRVLIKEKNTARQFYLDVNKFVSRDRWTRYGRNAKQFGLCVQKALSDHHIHDIEIYLDVWVSLNERFQQRFFDPTTDILASEWSPFQPTQWVMPLLSEFSEKRTEMRERAQQYEKQGESQPIVIFMADFPGMIQENRIHSDLFQTTLEVIAGEVAVEISNELAVTIAKGEKIEIPSGQLHKIQVISSTPACYVYVSRNRTEDNRLKLSI